jgi:hypothetical protein
VMVGEQAQEMQVAHWIGRTEIPALGRAIPPWIGMWFAVFPTYETLAAQFIAAVLVVGSYYAARHLKTAPAQEEAGIAPEPDAGIVERLETIPDNPTNERTASLMTSSRNGQSLKPVANFNGLRAGSQR